MAIISNFEVAAIAMAIHQHIDATSHDTESYVLTIKRKPQTVYQPQHDQHMVSFATAKKNIRK